MGEQNMVKEGLKKILPVMQAFVEGKTIQRYDDKKDDWYDIFPNANIDFCYDYRIKPEPKYRPFKSQEECLNEMMKHQPFGWFRSKNNKNLFNTVCINDEYIKTTNILTKYTDTYSDAFANLEFVDGTPFGIKEE